MPNIKEHTEYMFKSGLEDLSIAEYLFEGRKYSAALFYCHLTLEKLFKCLYALKYRNLPPYTHDLGRLSDKIKENYLVKRKAYLVVITGFNTSGRYPEEKEMLYNISNRKYTYKYIKITRTIVSLIKDHYQIQ